MALELGENYAKVLQDLKAKIRQARLRATVAVNTELLKVYWEIGNAINEEQAAQKWGAKVIDRLVVDLRAEFEDMKGLSPRNLRYMRDFASAYPSFIILQQPVANLEVVDNEVLTILQRSVAKLPWGHNCVLLDKLKSEEYRSFYATKAIEHGWTRDMLVNQIESKLHERQGALTSNFKIALPGYDSELAIQLFKDPYNLDFIMLSDEAKEKDLEDALLNHIVKFLLELGDGFAFMARQKTYEIGGKEFRIDLLFYHTKLRRYIVIDLKIGDFEPEFVSKMNLYLGLVDDKERKEHDEPSIGLILCKTKNKVVAEYALRDTKKPIGISEYKIGELLPDSIKGELPTIEEIEEKMDAELKEQENPTEARLRTIKEKLKQLKKEEIQTPATPAIHMRLYEDGIKLLFKKIIERLDVFTEDFHDIQYKWYVRDKTITDIAELDEFWKESTEKKDINEISFSYTLFGLKKAGTENYNDGVNLVFLIDTYWYGFRLINHNNQQPFLKKLYHQPLTDNDAETIIDLMVNKVIDGMDYFINSEDGKN